MRISLAAVTRLGGLSPAENGNCFTAASDLELLEDAVHMIFDSRDGNRQALRNFFVRKALVEHLDNLGFPRGQTIARGGRGSFCGKITQPT